MRDSLIDTLARGLRPSQQLTPRRGLKETLRTYMLSNAPPGAGTPRQVTAAGQLVSQETMIKLSAVWACVGLLSETIATLPIGLYRRRPDGSRIEIRDHPLARAISRKPAAYVTSVAYWQAYLASMLLWGNGYARKVKSAGQIIGLQLMIPHCVAPYRLPGTSEWRYRWSHDGKREELSADDVFHTPAFSIDGRFGLSPVQYGARVFGGAQAADAAANSVFEKGLQPTVAFKYPGVLRQDQRNEARATIKQLSGAVNAGEPVILEAGTEAMTIGINPKDAQLIETRAFCVEDVCRWFRVPPFMVGHAEKSTSWGTGIEQQMIGFVTFALRPWINRIEQEINTSLLTPVEQETMYAEFALEGLLRGDSQARANFYSQALQNGWMSRNLVRQLENLPPVEGGDVLTVQSNLIPIDQLGKAATPAATARNAFLSWLGVDDEKSRAEAS